MKAICKLDYVRDYNYQNFYNEKYMHVSFTFYSEANPQYWGFLRDN